MHNHYKEEEIQKQFANHVAKQTVADTHLGPVTVLTWRNKNGTSIDYITFVFLDGFLMVHGDLGEATYQWYQTITPEWVAKCELDYFHGKCQASEDGARPKEWDQDQAIKRIREHITYSFGVDSPGGNEYVNDDTGEVTLTTDHVLTAEQVFERYADADLEVVTESKHAWHDYYDGYVELGGKEDPYKRTVIFDSEDGNIGDIIPLRTRMHLYGLRMAVKQLQEKEHENETLSINNSQLSGIAGSVDPRADL